LLINQLNRLRRTLSPILVRPGEEAGEGQSQEPASSVARDVGDPLQETLRHVCATPGMLGDRAAMWSRNTYFLIE
jgi:hypothetical protein